VKGPQKWIGMPGRKFQGKDGKDAWYNYIRFESDEIRERFQKAIMALLPVAAEEHHSSDEQELPF
jgi:hypothetical protein